MKRNKRMAREFFDLAENKSYPENIHYLNKALKLDPYKADIYFVMGEKLVDATKNNQAIKCFDNALKYFSNASNELTLLDIYAGKAKALAFARKYEQALYYFDKALKYKGNIIDLQTNELFKARLNCLENFKRANKFKHDLYGIMHSIKEVDRKVKLGISLTEQDITNKSKALEDLKNLSKLRYYSYQVNSFISKFNKPVIKGMLLTLGFIGGGFLLNRFRPDLALQITGKAHEIFNNLSNNNIREKIQVKIKNIAQTLPKK
ncbi:MAG: hypothetical protein J0H68_07950 [Sphingobacteriia bacterium]|nr:hypothetical protein [Sphingobacteriia bacterium]